MQACTLMARAKINLYLEILGSRPDGYSEVAVVLQSIQLADRVQLKCCPHGIHLTCHKGRQMPATWPIQRLSCCKKSVGLLGRWRFTSKSRFRWQQAWRAARLMRRQFWWG